MKKPDGLTVLRPGEIERLLAPLPVGRIWGVGPKAEERLGLRGVRTIGDLLAMGPDRLARDFGDAARHWCELVRGVDDREVTPDTEAKSIGQERTFATVVTGELFQAARALFDTWASSSFRPIRLAGVSVGRFSRDGQQSSLFEVREHEKGRRLDAAVDSLRDRFGDGSLRRAGGRVEEGLAPSDKPPPLRKPKLPPSE